MFKALDPPVTTFRGYKVSLFRQGRTSQAVRRLYLRVVHFAPYKQKAAIFLPSAYGAFTLADLEAAWQQQGCPEVTPLAADKVLCLGQPLTVAKLPYAGYNAIYREGDTLHVLCKGMPGEDVAARVNAYLQTQLLAFAQQRLEAWQPRLVRLPRQIVIKPLRASILGQCTRDGEIRLNPILNQWPPEVIEETLAHELCHLEHFNHAPQFWTRLTTLLPDWLPRSLYHYL